MVGLMQLHRKFQRCKKSTECEGFYGFGFFSPVFVMLFFFLLLDFVLVDLGLEVENKSL